MFGKGNEGTEPGDGKVWHVFWKWHVVALEHRVC